MNRIEPYLTDGPPVSCPECEQARMFYAAANRQLANAALANIESRRMRDAADRLFWSSCLILFGAVCAGLFVVFAR